ncbi:uncharacterized protein BDZ99DRAFT_458337 [Mytilinidion resinicola]|uniref:FHA domain-containing protein n=1 Tax=Mytilinidion resinicola TaxID=574789 RepID=A0A6A6Z6X9_9PEZI|nr:uncharacterized protein BDZ99DRAFT_458337 [Mytilinidion resinicola]KAF2816469.1 hypothetical protein BDZ99DRAFT_458337 [Mytilinidion resinicola]
MASPSDLHPTPAAVEVTLRSLNPDVEHKERILIMEPSTTVSVGRASKSAHKNLRSSVSNAYIDSPVVSRDHALLTAAPTTGIPAVYIRDVGSMHGTAVNEHTLHKDEDMKLKNGDVVQFGADVVRDSHTYTATKFRFDAKPYTSSGTFGLPDSDYAWASDDEDANSDVSDYGGPSSAVDAYPQSELADDLHPTITLSSTPKSERLGTQSNPYNLADDEQEKPHKPVVIDLDPLEEDDRLAKEAAFNYEDASASFETAKIPLQSTPDSSDQPNLNTDRPSSIVLDTQRGYGYVVNSPSPSRNDYAESDCAGSSAPASPSEASSGHYSPREDNEYESGYSDSDASVNDYVPQEAATEFDGYSDNASETSEIESQVDLAEGDIVSDVDEADLASEVDESDIARVKMLEMLDHAKRPQEERTCGQSDPNAADPETPSGAQAKDISKGQLSTLPTPPQTLTRPLESLPSLRKSPVHEQRGQASVSMALKNFIHQDKDAKPTISSMLGKAAASTPISRHPWDWSHAYEDPWDSTGAVPHIFGHRDEDMENFATTSSRFDNPYVSPPSPYLGLSGGPYTRLACSPQFEQSSNSPFTFAPTPTANTQSMPPKLSQGQVGHLNGLDTHQKSTYPVPTSGQPTTIALPVDEKQKERTGMSISEIVEAAVSKEDEPVKSKKRKLSTVEAEDADSADVQSTMVAQNEPPSHIAPVVEVTQSPRPIKRTKVRKTATTMAGILIGTVSAVGALAFLPDVFFQ